MAEPLVPQTPEKAPELTERKNLQQQILVGLFGAEKATELMKKDDGTIWDQQRNEVLASIRDNSAIRAAVEQYMGLDSVPANDLNRRRFEIILRQIDRRAVLHEALFPATNAPTPTPPAADPKAPPATPAEAKISPAEQAGAFKKRVSDMGMGDLIMEMAKSFVDASGAIKGLGNIIDKAMGTFNNRFDDKKLLEATIALDADKDTAYEANKSAACVLKTLGLEITEGGTPPENAEDLLKALQNSKLALQEKWVTSEITPRDILFFSTEENGKKEICHTAVVIAVKPKIRVKTTPPEGGPAVEMDIEGTNIFNRYAFAGVIHLPTAPEEQKTDEKAEKSPSTPSDGVAIE